MDTIAIAAIELSSVAGVGGVNGGRTRAGITLNFRVIFSCPPSFSSFWGASVVEVVVPLLLPEVVALEVTGPEGRAFDSLV